jgi:trimeric autotransporter adhesin
MTNMNRNEKHQSLIGLGGKMKRSWLSHLFISLSIGLLAIGVADAATMVPITTCTGCHGTNPLTNASPIEGSVRNNPVGSILGSHVSHASLVPTCAGCHVVPTPTAMDHRDGKINMASPMSGGVTYSVAVGGIVTQDNQVTTTGMGTCLGTSCHSSASPVWGSASTCQTCHGYPPVSTDSGAPTNHIGTGATVNTKATFVSTHGGCQICHGTQSTTDATGNTHDPHANYVVSAQHNNNSLNMNGPVGTGTGYNSSIRACAAACHTSTVAPYRMTASGLTLTYGDYGSGGDCLSCHNVASLASPIAAGLGGPATRRNVVAEHKNLWSHKRSSAGGVPANTVVTVADCIVCHMEGDKASGGTTGVHKDGYIDLRDPDTGLQIKNVTWNGATPGAYVEGATNLRFVRFGRNLAVTLSADPNWLVIAAIQQNHCLKCHDTGGAANASAQVPTGGTALRPFGVAITGHTSNTVMNNVLGSVYDVKTNLLTSNASYHPVMGKQNNSFADLDTMTAPYNQVTRTAGSATAYGDLISCWDCHAPAGASGAQTMTVTAHGGAATLRSPVFAGGTTAAANLCLVCHKTIYATTSGRHSTSLSAFSAGATDMSATTMAGCRNCHSSYLTTRPIRAEDVHGFNNKTPLTAASKWTSGSRPYSFYRTTRLGDWAPRVAAGDTLARTSTCNSGGCSNGSMDGSNGIVGTGGTY